VPASHAVVFCIARAGASRCTCSAMSAIVVARSSVRQAASARRIAPAIAQTGE
jgi:hypothetical protein